MHFEKSSLHTNVKMTAGFEAKYHFTVRCHHFCKDIWTPTYGEVLMSRHKEENEHDHFAVS
jgi:hypothetical protein